MNKGRQPVCQRLAATLKSAVKHRGTEVTETLTRKEFLCVLRAFYVGCRCQAPVIVSIPTNREWPPPSRPPTTQRSAQAAVAPGHFAERATARFSRGSGVEA